MAPIRGRIAACLALVMVLFSARLALGENLCPPPDPPIAEDDRRLEEKDLSEKHFADALEYFDVEFPRYLKQHEKTADVTDTETMIGYSNMLIAIKGYSRRLEALLRRAERDLVTERSLRGRATKQDVAAAKARFEQAKQRFCSYLKNTFYSD